MCYLVENGNFKLAGSIINLIKNFNNVKHNSHIQFNKSYNMAVSFKLNNADFLQLSFPNFSKSCSSVFLSLPYATAYNSLSDNVSLSSKHHLAFNFVKLFKPVPVNVSFAPMHVRVNVVKSVSCNLRVSSLAKPTFIYLNTVRSLNVCNALKFVKNT